MQHKYCLQCFIETFLTTAIDKTQITYSILYSLLLSIYYSLTMTLYVIDKSTYHLLCYIILPLKEGSSHWHSGHGAGWWHFTQWLIWFYRFSVGFSSRESAGDTIWDTATFSWTFKSWGIVVNGDKIRHILLHLKTQQQDWACYKPSLNPINKLLRLWLCKYNQLEIIIFNFSNL